jgi:hypothetical protein
MANEADGMAISSNKELRERKRILFFTRGRGRGHAIPDLLIVDHLRRLAPSVDVQFVSYGTGARTLRNSDVPLVDLGFADDNNFLDTLIPSAECIQRYSPDLVVSHEEFAAVTAAQLTRAPVVFVTDWFMDKDSLFMYSIRSSMQILFIGDRGLFEEPDYLKGKVRYMGNLIRPFEYTRADWLKARAELGLSKDTLIVSVIPGVWANEDRCPMFDLVTSAFREIPTANKRLLWIAGNDYKELCNKSRTFPSVKIFPYHDPIERVMVASDAVITKGNRGTTLELAELRVPSISLSYGLNPVDDTIVCRLPNNVALNVRAVNSRYLSEKIHALTENARMGNAPSSAPPNTTAQSVAQLLLEALVARPTRSLGY